MDRYEEAMSRCKQWEREHPNGFVIQDMVEFIFPEMKESKDEEIRMWLTRLISTNGFCERESDPMPCGRTRILAWLEKQKEQKPAEWSEEKEKALDNYVDEIIKWEDAHKDWNRDIIRATAFHFFNLQSKQEWSEEDEKIMQTMIKEGDLKPSEIAWLKSLRPQPHWKPSEEQMIYLKEAINKFDFCDAENAGLQALYEQLKKLH